MALRKNGRVERLSPIKVTVLLYARNNVSFVLEIDPSTNEVPIKYCDLKVSW